MNVGVLTACNAESIGPAPLASALEARGFDALFLPEHTHIPVSETCHPDGTPLPGEYYRNLDPFVALAVAAGATSRLRLGTAVSLLVQRDPITFAKEVATLDLLSSGRVEVGVGAGWNRREMRDHGTDPRSRTRLLEERILAARAIWTEEVAEFHGRFVDFPPLYSWPKPVQRPHPRIWLAGWGPTTFERALAVADGWLAPVDLTPAALAGGMQELERTAAARGRPRPPVIATLTRPTPETVRAIAAVAPEQLLFGIFQTAPERETLARLDELALLRGQALAAG